MKKITSILSLVFLFYFNQKTIAQNSVSRDAGIEYQIYPAGMMFGVHAASNFAEHHGIQIRAGYNKANRKDFSPYNDYENGGGLGLTLGYRYYFGKNKSYNGLFAGLRTDLWNLKINWKDNLEDTNTLNDTQGTTDILVLQPTLEIGYRFNFANERWFVAPTIANGFEINIKTKGEEVGQGFISLLGVSAGYRF